MQNVDNTSALRRIGFSDQEVDLYISLLSLGGAKASAVAKDTGTQRTAVYHTLKNMASKGYVHVYFKNNQKYFHAKKPHKLAALYSKKLDNLYAFLPQLQAIEKKSKTAVGLRFIQSLDELKEFYTGILYEYADKEYNIIGSAGDWENLDTEWFRQFRVDRARNNIRTKLLLTESSRGISPEDGSLLRDVKFVPEKYVYKSIIDIFDDKVLIVSSELSALAVVIEVPVMRDVFMAMFDMLWDTSDFLSSLNNSTV